MRGSPFLVFLFLLACCSIGQSQTKNDARNQPPVISKFESSSQVVKTCEPMNERLYCVDKSRRTVSLTVTASDPENEPLTYAYKVTGGQILGEGPSVNWKVGDQPFGSYSVTVTASDSKGAEASSTLQVSVAMCVSCGIADPPCPLIAVTGSDEITYRGEFIHFHGVVQTDSYFQDRPDYIWTVTNGKIVKGQHTPWLTVEATGEPGRDVTAILDAKGGFDSSCLTKAKATSRIKP